MKKDNPELTRELVIRLMAKRHLKDSVQLTALWRRLDADEQTAITAISKALHPDEVQQQEYTTRALLVQKILTKDQIDREVVWTRHLSELFQEPCSSPECCKES